MSNGLNIRLVNNVTAIAQGDTASFIIVELLDETKTVMPNLNGKNALINFIDKKGDILYQINTVIFDSRVEFNIEAVLPVGEYKVEIRVYADSETYVFPSSVNYQLKINRSANNYYTNTIEQLGINAVVNEVYEQLESDNAGMIGHSTRKDNPHEVTIEQLGIEKVINVEQASKEDFDAHTADSVAHVTATERQTWNDKPSKEYVDDAVNGIDTVSSTNFNNHVGNNVLHWQEGERDQISQAIAASKNEANQYTDAEVLGLNNTLDSHVNNADVHLSVEQKQAIADAATVESDVDIEAMTDKINIDLVQIRRIDNVLLLNTSLSFNDDVSVYMPLAKLINMPTGKTVNAPTAVTIIEASTGSSTTGVLFINNGILMIGYDFKTYDQCYINCFILLEDE